MLNLVWFLIMVITVGLALLSAYELRELDSKFVPCKEDTSTKSIEILVVSSLGAASTQIANRAKENS